MAAPAFRAAAASIKMLATSRKAARRAAGQDPNEAAESEAEGLERAKEEDPEVDRDYQQPTKPTGSA